MSDPTPPVSSTYELIRPMEVYVITPPRRRYWVNVLLLAATIFSTLLVGARLQYSFLNNLPAFPDLGVMKLFPLRWALEQPSRLLLGVPFCATLMFILLAHEMGHYLYCRYYGVYATLPFFIPAPTLIGTLGAFIRIKSPIRSRVALFDIGIAGPVAGFSAASVILFYALMFSKRMTESAADSAIQFGYPLIFYFLQWIRGHLGITRGAAVPLDVAYLHPTAIAAWVGMFATALNLLPGGQLDGGHIVYSVFPRAHRWASRLTVVGLLFASWWWAGWLLWALLLRLSGMRHPQVPAEPGLTAGRRRLFVLAIVMLALTFIVAPLRGGGIKDLLESLFTS
jgi:membrane-associated protease RseP (regulator of RpoE activity)